MSYSLLTDEMAVKLLKASDEKAFEVIYQRYWKIIYLSALKKLRSPHMAEELTQSLFVNIWEKRESSNIENLSAYLQTAIKYKVINFIESRYANQWSIDEDNSELVIDNSTEDTVLLQELNQAIDNAILLLPPKTREVFKLSRFERFSVRQIAAELNISEKAVEYHITQSLKFLRLELKDYMVFSYVVVSLQLN
ncbi:RNA polymerase sigma factor [Lacibacter sp.]|uniref:RNA polymerase sigma factor n=1 Tax=Lacibacter sp. TaxID=1915409 RepID=UPI002B4B6C76|nr:sigma-70 family RNA polymerase sigma factor [Lacibacter sp.]HLP38178.1 sigma-70 family RNA polymerase sigma factor [Lacibacter sp.]